MLSNLVTWEARYTDGTIISEREGWKYDQLVRQNLYSFGLSYPDGSNVFELAILTQEHENTFVYRRRNFLTSDGGKKTIFILGFLNGPVFGINVDEGTYRKLDNGFNPGDEELYPVELMPGESKFLIKG